MKTVNVKIAHRIALVVILLLQHVSGQSYYVSDPEQNNILDIKNCQVYSGFEAQNFQGNVKVAPPEIYQRLVSNCRPSSRGEWSFIFPGTKWCGPGNRANGYYDLGSHAIEDACCREHDNCPVNMEPGQCRGDVCNEYSVTLSHCACDARFRRCLQAADTDVADFIGWIYFNLVHVKCFKARVPCNDFREDCPIALHSVLPYRSARHATTAGTLASVLFGFRRNTEQ